MNERKHPGSVASWRWELAPRSGIPAPTPGASRLRLTMALGSPLPPAHQQDQVHTTRALGEEKQSLPQAVSGGPSHLRSVLGLWGG